MSELAFERRFVVKDQSFLVGRVGDLVIQGYLFVSNEYSVRVRRAYNRDHRDQFKEAVSAVTVKGPRSGTLREEYRVEVPAPFAAQLLKLTRHKVIKARYGVSLDRNWIVDVFHGDNEGLVIAETEDRRPLTNAPSWLGREVTGEARYDNAALAYKPFNRW